MDHLLYLLDSAGLDTADKIYRASKEWPIKRVHEVREQSCEILQAGSTAALKKTDPSDPFDFVASSSMRGEDGCLGLDCRIQKARTLSRYGALYARRVLIPIRVGILHNKEESEFFVRYSFAGTLMSILEYRPLIESGVAVLSAGALPYCREHLDEAVPSHPKIEKVASFLHTREYKKFSATIVREANRPDRLRLRGPEDYLPHGEVSFGFFDEFARATGKVQSRREARSTASLARARRNLVVKQLFHRLAYDVTVQQYFTSSSKATYLTDMPGEARVLALLNASEESETRNALFAKHLLHSVPLLNEVAIDVIVKLRKEEPDAFLQYRAAIAKIVRECGKEKTPLSEKDARDISRDILEPELARLRIQANTIRRAGLRKAAVKTAASFVAVGLGLYGSLLPSELAELFKLTGGVGLLSQIGESLGLIEKNPGEIKNQDLYFLLKLQKRASK